MKIIHTSDCHIDSPLTSRLEAGQVTARKREILETFRRLTEEANRQRADAVIIAGDLFDTERISPRARAGVLTAMERAAEVTFFYLPGNHERSALLQGDGRLPQNLRVFGPEWTRFDAGDVSIAGRSETAPGMFDTLTLDPARCNIVVLHGELRDRSDVGGIIGEGEAAALPIDYLALGHYHSYSEKPLGRGVAVYSGTPEGRGFDEVGEKGFVEVQTRGRTVQHRFVPFAKRTLRLVTADMSRTGTLLEREWKVEEAIAGIGAQDLLRVVLTGSVRPGERPDTEALTARYRNRFYYLEVRDETRIAISPQEYKNDLSLKGEFIRLVMENGDLDERQKERVLHAGLSALAGETEGL